MRYPRTMIRTVPMVFVVAAVSAHGANKHYPAGGDDAAPTAFVALPVGAVRPTGWLKDQLTVQANGLTGHLEEFWGSLKNSAWRGMPKGEDWERGPYYLDGLVPLAYVLEDSRLIAKVKPWMDWMIASGQPSGWFGPASNPDRWPRAVALKVLMQYQEATSDPRALEVVRNYFKYLGDNPPDWPDKEWRGMRAMENAVAGFWLYRRTGDPDILKVIRSIYDHSFKWTEYFTDFPFTDEVLAKGHAPGHPSHVVNIAMAIKYPGIYYPLSRDIRHKDAVYVGMKSLDKYHGQACGRFAGDEHLSGRRPTQGTELCAVVEYMFSLEKLVEVFGDPALADRIELLGYNANPGGCTADYWAHQYDQQSNQVLVSVAKREWRTNDDTSNIYGLEPNYGCCTANMHQGWPKLVTHLWMATQDNGLAAIVYGPSRVKAKVGETGEEVTIVQETDYPFDGQIRFLLEIAKPTDFPLQFRIPAWAEDAELKVGDDMVPAAAGKFAEVRRTFKNGDEIVLALPMRVRAETRYNKAVSIMRGPLCFSLRIGEKWTKLKAHSDTFPSFDWQIEPTTPWNYGLVIDPANPAASITTFTDRPGPVPYDTARPPVTLRVKGKAIPGWTLVNNSAGPTPLSPVTSEEPETTLELIPYGSTRLRITEFPVIKN